PVAPPLPDYIPGPKDPQTPPVPQDEDEHEFLDEEQPLPPEYEDDETEDGPVDYPMDGGGDDGDDDDGDSSRDDGNDEDEDEKEEAYASREAWAHSIGLSQATHQELQTHHDHVYAY
ncbi:hypothetical protein Tco_0390011, partial [Tanacetum coccineum]